MKRALLATTMLVCAAGAASAQTCSVPGPAAAAGYTQQTFGGPLNLGTTPNASTSYPVIGGGVDIVPDTFFGQSWQSIGASGANGSVTLNGAGETYGDGLSTAEVTPAGQPLQGIAFGGGGYFQITMAGNGPMSFWMNDAETMNGLSNGSGSGNSWIEADIAEFDSTNAYGFTLHNWYGTPGSGNVVNANENGASPAGANYTQPNTYGMLWVPATATTQGQAEFFFNGQQVGNTVTWNQYIPGQSATANPFAVMDSLHMVPILGANPGTTVTFSNLEVWQASNANDIGTQVAAAAAAAPCNGGATVTTPFASTLVSASAPAAPSSPANAPAPASQPVAALQNDPTPGEGTATDCSGNVWFVNSDNEILENGVPVVGGGDTSNLIVQGCTVIGKSNGQNGSSLNWFTMNSSSPTTTDGWTVSAAPTTAVTDALPQTLATQPATAASDTPAIPTPAVCGSGVSSGAFKVVNGRIIGPDGKDWIGRGINAYDSQLGDASAMIAMFPGLNFIRISVGHDGYHDPSYYQSFVTQMTTAGRVVELEHHPDGGGGQDNSPPGGLAAENAWYASVAGAFKKNPRVWFGTFNEPGTGGAGGLSVWHKATYDAIRNTGNTSPILIEPGGSRSWNLVQWLDPSVYTSMTNIVMDPHVYGYQTDFNTDQAANDANVAAMIAAAQTIKSADGTIAVMIAEYGNSTTGDGIDPNGVQNVTAVVSAGASGKVGSAAWAWLPGGPDDHLQNGGVLTSPYGQQVALYINTSIMACSTAELNANANTTLTAITAQVTGAPTAAPVSTITATSPGTSTTVDPDDAAIAQANAIITAAQAQLKANQ